MTAFRALISVLMPIYNCEAYFADAWESLLNQSETPWEGVIVNDGSTLQLRCARDRVEHSGSQHRWIDRPHLGLARALNCGLAFCRTKYIARMDGDDICAPGRFKKQLEYLEAHPDVVAVGSWVMLIDEDGDPIGPAFDKSTSHEDIVDALLCRRTGVTGICHPSVMMRTEAVRQIGGYRDVKMGEDIDLFLRLAEIGRLANIPEFLLHYRVHAKSITLNRSEEERQASQQVRIQAYQRLGIPLPPDLSVLKPAPPPGRVALYRWWSRHAARHGNMKTARKYAWRLLLLAPHKLDTWKTLARSVIGYRKSALCVSSS